MVLTDSLISGPIPNDHCHCTAAIHSITASCLTISRDKCNVVFTLVAKDELVNACGDVHKAYITSFLSSKSSSGGCRRVASNSLQKMSKHRYIDRTHTNLGMKYRTVRNTGEGSCR